MSDWQKWPRKKFEELPEREWNEDIGKVDSIVILPMRARHDSGYRLLDFVAIQEWEPTCRLSGCSDVIHIQQHDPVDQYPAGLARNIVNIDCLPVSGLLHIFSWIDGFDIGAALSSFDITVRPRSNQ